MRSLRVFLIVTCMFALTGLAESAVYVTWRVNDGSHVASSNSDPGTPAPGMAVGVFQRDFSTWNPTIDWDPVTRAPRPISADDPDLVRLIKTLTSLIQQIKAKTDKLP